MAQSGYTKRLGEIISPHIDCFGFCSFESVRDSLISCRAIARIPQNAQGIITVLFPYCVAEENYIGANISRYACVADYHGVALGILQKICEDLKSEWPDELFEPFVDNSPIPEVRAAALSGLGRVGKNGLLINGKYGSWIFIGEVVTTLCLDDSDEIRPCDNCGLCEAKCPTGALRDGIVDKIRCLSEITQCKSALNVEQELLIKNSGCAWGCDVCQLVCPHNAGVQTTDIEEFLLSFSPLADADNLENKAYGWRGRRVIERNIRLLEG